MVELLFLKGKGIVFEYERLRNTANERKPSTLPIRVVHQRMAQTTEDRAAINDRWRQLSRRIVQQREHEFHSIIEQNAYTIRTRCTRNPLKGFAPFLGLTTLRWPFRGNPPFPLFNPCRNPRVFPPFSRITNFKNGKRDNIFHLLDWKLKITRRRRGEFERIWIFSSIPYRARIVENINKNFRDFFEANGVKSLSRARGAKEKFHFHFPFPRGKAIIRESSPRNFFYTVSVQSDEARQTKSKVCATITIVVLYLNTREFPRFLFLSLFPPFYTAWQSLEAVFTTFLLSSGTLVTVEGETIPAGWTRQEYILKLSTTAKRISSSSSSPSISCERLKTLTFMTLLRLRASYGDETRQTAGISKDPISLRNGKNLILYSAEMVALMEGYLFTYKWRGNILLTW